MITPKDEEVRRHGPWANNAELMHDVNRVHPFPTPIVDVTYGAHGGFWKKLSTEHVLAGGLGHGSEDFVADFQALPFADQSVPTIVFDPPYKLSGTPAMDYDERYGIDVPTRWQDRMELIETGTAECARVTKTMLLVKVQDQVASKQMRWQSDNVTRIAEVHGLRKADRFELSSYRKQPSGRSQQHSRTDSSILLVFLRD